MNRRPPVADQDTSLREHGNGCAESTTGISSWFDRRLRPVGVLDEGDLSLQWPPSLSEALRGSRCVSCCTDRPAHRRAASTTWATVARTILVTRTDAVPMVDDGRPLGLMTGRHCIELLAPHVATSNAPGAIDMRRSEPGERDGVSVAGVGGVEVNGPCTRCCPRRRADAHRQTPLDEVRAVGPAPRSSGHQARRKR
jgi:hypothetical protein